MLIISAWIEDGCAAVKASTDTQTDVYLTYGPSLFACLCETLDACEGMREKELVFVSNDTKVKEMFTRPIKLPVISTRSVEILCGSPNPYQIHKSSVIGRNARRGTIRSEKMHRVSKDGKATAAYMAETIDKTDPYLWAFARWLMRFDKWQIKYTTKMPGTRTYWKKRTLFAVSPFA